MMKIELTDNKLVWSKGQVLDVERTVPHGGYTDDSHQYVVIHAGKEVHVRSGLAREITLWRLQRGYDMDDQLEELRKHLLDQLDMLQQAYRRDAQPILDKLVKIESLRAPTPIILIDNDYYASNRRAMRWEIRRNP